MFYTVELPEGKSLKLYYTPKVYSPEYSAVDTIVIADRLIKEAKGQITSVHDVACGSGVLGLGIKILNPDIKVTMSDKSPEAVRIASKNAKSLKLDVGTFKADLLGGVVRRDMVVANLPTFSSKQMKSEKLHGPPSSYFGGLDPLFLYAKLFKQVKSVALVLVCECQKEMQKEFLLLAKLNGLKLILATDNSFAFLTV